MKKLLIFRHAKTEPYGSKIDFNRELTNVGVNQFKSISKRLSGQISSIDLTLFSAARRTTQTFDVLTQFIKTSSSEAREDMYNSDSSYLKKLIWEIPSDINSVCLIAHNPGMSDLASYMFDESIRLRPGEGMIFQLDVESWSEVFGGNFVSSVFFDVK